MLCFLKKHCILFQNCCITPNIALAFKTIASPEKISMRSQNFSIVKKVLFSSKALHLLAELWHYPDKPSISLQNYCIIKKYCVSYTKVTRRRAPSFC